MPSLRPRSRRISVPVFGVSKSAAPAPAISPSPNRPRAPSTRSPGLGLGAMPSTPRMSSLVMSFHFMSSPLSVAVATVQHVVDRLLEPGHHEEPPRGDTAHAQQPLAELGAEPATQQVARGQGASEEEPRLALHAAADR